MSLSPANVQQQPARELPPLDANYGKAVRLGLFILLVGLGGFLLWAVFAPLDEGVPMAGVVSVESKRKRVDHLTGGIIAKIAVREGQLVKEGDELVVLDEVQTRAALNAVESQWRSSLAAEARLTAEQSGLAAVRFPKELADAAANPDVATIMRAQSELFRSRRNALTGELRIIRESVAGLEQQIQSLDQLALGRQQQILLFNEQLTSFRKLHAGNFVSRNQLIEVERQLAEVQTKQSEDLANIAAVRARLAEFRMRGGQRETEYRREVETQLTDVQKEVATLGERAAALRDTNTRLVLRAPVSGTVVELAYHTIGGVIKPGDRILDIVPAGDDLIVEAQVGPQYIDRVRAGLLADVHFDAYLRNIEPPVVSGKVKVVSADAVTDPRTGVQFYTLRVTVPASELKKLGDLQIQPGMQGTVMVKTGERSLLVYLLRPLFRRFNTAMGER
jgi:protease secretion system membrane fusion protein